MIAASPCVRVCRLSEVNGWCLGCGRAADEIARWFYLSEDERRAISADLPSRLSAHAATSFAQSN